MSESRILILFAHPAFQRSRGHRFLVEAVRQLDDLTFRDLYEQYPDFNIDVAAEQRLLVEHDIIVLQHPLYWYSCPALLKEWLDLVLEYGFAYGDGGEALRDKKMLSAITTGGSDRAYTRDGLNHCTIWELLAPFRQTARFCGLEYLPPFVVHGMLNNPTKEELLQTAEQYVSLLRSLRNGSLPWRDLAEGAYLNEATP